MSLSFPTSPQRGPDLIAVGLGVVLVAQLAQAVPVAAAMMLIGCGATQILRATRSQLLLTANLVVYATLGCFAIAAQTHSAVSGSGGRVGLLLWVDHLVAVFLLVVMANAAMKRLNLPTAFDR